MVFNYLNYPQISPAWQSLSEGRGYLLFLFDWAVGSPNASREVHSCVRPATVGFHHSRACTRQPRLAMIGHEATKHGNGNVNCLSADTTVHQLTDICSNMHTHAYLQADASDSMQQNFTNQDKTRVSCEIKKIPNRCNLEAMNKRPLV